MPIKDKASNFKARTPVDFESKIFDTLTQIDKKVDHVTQAVDRDRIDVKELMKYSGTNRVLIVATLGLQIIGFAIIFSIIAQLL